MSKKAKPLGRARHARGNKFLNSDRRPEGWFYENRGSIDVYLRREGQFCGSVRITKRQILEWLKRCP